MNYRLKTIALGMAVAFALGACSQPQSQDKDADSKDEAPEVSVVEKIQPLVETSSRGQYKAIKSFEGPDGLVGILLEANQGGGKLIAWTTESGEVLMPGPLFDSTGSNLSETMLAQHAGYISNEELADRLLDRGFVAGKSGPILTVFFEPYCGYCNRLFEQVRPLIDSGKMRMRVVMVGFLRPDSLARAAEIEFAKDPWGSLKRWEARKDKAGAPEAKADPENIAKIQANGELMTQAGKSGTPAILYCKTDGTLDFIGGMPGDFASFQAGVSQTGHAICGDEGAGG